MAHIGQSYRVAFRRDFAQNVPTYRSAYPEIFVFEQTFTPRQGPWFPGQPYPWNSLPPVFGVSPMATWTWPTFTSMGYLFELVATVLIPRTPAALVYAKIELKAGGVTRCTVTDSNPLPPTFELIPADLDGWHLTQDWTGTPFNPPVFPNVRARFWSDV